MEEQRTPVLVVGAIGAQADLVDVDHDSAARLGIEAAGAMLVRPDSFIAWRTSHVETTGAPPQVILEQVLRQILGR